MPTHSYLPDTFLVWAPKVLNPRKPLTPATIVMVGHPAVSTPPVHPGGQCAQDVSWATQVTGLPAGRARTHDLVTSSGFFAPRLHFSGCSMRQNTRLSPVILAKAFPWDGCDGEIAERGSSGGLGHPWGSNGSGRWDPKRGLNLCLKKLTL